MSTVDDLRRLTRTSRGKGRLDPAPEREGIAESVSEAVNSGQTTPGGCEGLELTSSDGFIILGYDPNA